MVVTAEKFHRNSSRFLRMIRGGTVEEIRVTFHGVPAVRIGRLDPAARPRRVLKK